MDDLQIQAIIDRFGGASSSGDPDDVGDQTMQRLAASHSSAAEGREIRRDDVNSLARLIDHTVLKPETTVEDVRRACDEAIEHGFAAVCVNPCYVPLVAVWLAGTPVKTCTVVGFPLGAASPESKAREAELAVLDGADEIDMVLNVGMLKSGEYDFVEHDIRSVVEVVREKGVFTKIILETALLSDEEKVIGCLLAQRARADFVKTSTGFASAGATVEDVALMRRVVGTSMSVKAAGGIRTADDARAMIDHGANRIGASSSVAIIRGGESDADY